MQDFIVIAVVLVIIGAAVTYIVKEKKRGVKCIGCPAAGNCAGHGKHQGNTSCSCSCCSENK